MTDTRGLLERLDEGPVICAEGYLFELERRGYLQAGAFVPEVVLAHPEKVTELHREFVHAGSDVVEAFTYYAHREKLRIIGKEHLLEEINRQALALARDVARETGTMLAGNVCNTNVWTGERRARRRPRDVRGAGRLGGRRGGRLHHRRDVLVGRRGAGRDRGDQGHRPAGGHHADAAQRAGHARRARPSSRRARRLEAAGADVVGLNCARGPRDDAAAARGGPRRGRDPRRGAAGAVPDARRPSRPSSRCATRSPTAPDHRAFPTGLDPFTCSAVEVARLLRRGAALGVHYLGLCCGAAPHHMRAMAEALGRSPEASHYSADMSKHATSARTRASSPSTRPTCSGCDGG